MGKIFFVVMVMIATLLEAKQIAWVHTFAEASKQSNEQKKPIFFVVTTTKDDLTYTIEEDTTAVKLIEKNFIPLVAYKDKSDFIPTMLYKPDVNSLWFLAPNGMPLYQQQSTQGHIMLHDLNWALVRVHKDMQRNLERERLRNTPYEFHADFQFYTDLQAAKKASKASGKPIFLLVGRTACQYCRKLKKEVLYDPEVLKTIEKNYELVVLDARFSIPYKYQTPGIPAIWFLDSNGDALEPPFVGFVEKERLLGAMRSKKTQREQP